ncbi:hypothetical protein GCM10009802_01980 [Streptomyces synnematoformans]|uniref:Uncharacterized protein n=1 Tax=Streptomyces synnematoformans TaxID=415721 RepID=A0ABN2XA03_9ACTN
MRMLISAGAVQVAVHVAGVPGDGGNASKVGQAVGLPRRLIDTLAEDPAQRSRCRGNSAWRRMIKPVDAVLVHQRHGLDAGHDSEYMIMIFII